MDRYQERVDDLMQNHVLETTENTYLSDSDAYQSGGGIADKQLRSPNGGFPPIYERTKDEIRDDKIKVKREYTKQKNVVPISEIMKNRREKNDEPEPFIDLSRLVSSGESETVGSEVSFRTIE